LFKPADGFVIPQVYADYSTSDSGPYCIACVRASTCTRCSAGR